MQMSCKLHSPAVLPPEKNPGTHLILGMDGSGEEKKISYPSRDSNLGPFNQQLVAISTELTQ
jgi:hypothetical protein